MGVPKTSNMVVLGEYLFAVTFTLTRVVNLPLVVLACYMHAQTSMLRVAVVLILGSVRISKFVLCWQC